MELRNLRSVGGDMSGGAGVAPWIEQVTDREAVFAWSVGALNAVLAVIAVDVAYTMLSTGGVYLVPWWLAAPYGLLIAWRASRFVRSLMHDRVRAWQPAAEGFALLFVSALVYLAFNVTRAQLAGAEPSAPSVEFWLATAVYVLVYAVPAGLFGGLVGLLLGALDTLIVSLRRS